MEVAFAGCAVAIVIAFLVYAFKSHGNDAAAWVQAVGSIAAIGVAIQISNRQHRNDVKRSLEGERRDAKRSTTILGALIGNLQSVANNAANDLEDPNKGDTQASRAIVLRGVSQLQKSLYELPLMSMPDEATARLLVDSRWIADMSLALAERRNKIVVDSGGATGKGREWRQNQEQLSKLIDRLTEANKAFD
ncbi:hypothetical protein [Burkholderia lata]|uniref:hypothetical protein n=1 Tax=Burkholderia lata (strain ATCC 17760 / DSM 23089 / LMG 22485 / NCIMB 9086 / R18194 / 383) TaxID=482957 RepID=UPI001581BA92|nr:hypothetical protein [Burkholderia lata]